MDWYPLWNSLRIAAISSVAVFFSWHLLRVLRRKAATAVQGHPGCGADAAHGASAYGMWLFPVADLRCKTPRRSVSDAVWNQVCHDVVRRHSGGHRRGVPADVPHGARGAFEAVDKNLGYSAQTLGRSNTWIFWRVRMPACKQGISAGCVLAFARALGEYGATSMLIGYTPGKTATISTTVYQLWRTNDESGAMLWVLINLGISAVVLLSVNMLEGRQKKAAMK